MTRQEYEAIDAVNFSKLKWIAKSPAHYQWHLKHRTEETDALRRGRCVHLAVLEPEEFTKQIVIFDGTRRGNAWEEFSAAHADKTILKPDEHAECVAMAAAVRADSYANALFVGGEAEKTVVWECEGVMVKSRLDYLRPGEVTDLKTGVDVSPDSFGRSAVNRDLAAQAAIYVDGVFATTGKEPSFSWACVESEKPHVVAVYLATPEVLDFGRTVYRSWIRRLRACRELNHWPSYTDGPQPMRLPRWAFSSLEGM